MPARALPLRSRSPVRINRRLSYFPYTTRLANPFESPPSPSTRRLILVVLASAIPSFLLGTTLTSYVLINEQSKQLHCACDANRRPLRAASAVAGLPTKDAARSLQSSSLLLETTQQIENNYNSQGAVTDEAEEQVKRPDRLPAWVEHVVEERLEEERALWLSQQEPANGNNPNPSVGQSQPRSSQTLQERTGNYVRAMATTPKESFTNLLDLGVPLDPPRQGSSDVLLIYSSDRAVPLGVHQQSKASQRNSNNNLVQLPAEEALAQCDYVHVILTDHSQRSQCIALVPQFESFHIQRWGRYNPGTKNVVSATSPESSDFPFQLIPHSTKMKGYTEFRTPSSHATTRMWDMLRVYLQNLDVVKQELGEILRQIAIDQTVIVMVCNFGQSELLMNFACSSRARGFDLSNVVVFATDEETNTLAKGLGLNAYYDYRNFENIPKEAAGNYGDNRFTAMMLAKVISVQLVSLLGYHVLFQDVDVIWFRNPLEYFNGPNSTVKDFDVVFQDDGSRTLRYAPYSANSGFYFVRHNDKTRHFLSSLLMRVDEILVSRSHQKAMVALMTEHVTLFGLHAKVVSRTQDELPGGYQWNQKSGQFMHDLFDGKVHPYIFHMSWTSSKENKLKYFRQMGEWYVHDVCIQKVPNQITGFANNGPPTCCSAEPLVSCHFKDKPSKMRCDDSPNIDKGRAAFWK